MVTRRAIDGKRNREQEPGRKPDDGSVDLPSTGTLTFLFTDLEDSTRLWERFPEAMKVALGRHDAILRAAIESSGGQVVKTTGDGMMAVFGGAVDATAAALAAQLGILAEAWGETGRLRVRMGIHSGQAEHRGDDYFGSSRQPGRAHHGRGSRRPGAPVRTQPVPSHRAALPAGADLTNLGGAPAEGARPAGAPLPAYASTACHRSSRRWRRVRPRWTCRPGPPGSSVAASELAADPRPPCRRTRYGC